LGVSSFSSYYLLTSCSLTLSLSLSSSLQLRPWSHFITWSLSTKRKHYSINFQAWLIKLRLFQNETFKSSAKMYSKPTQTLIWHFQVYLYLLFCFNNGIWTRICNLNLIVITDHWSVLFFDKIFSRFALLLNFALKLLKKIHFESSKLKSSEKIIDYYRFLSFVTKIEVYIKIWSKADSMKEKKKGQR